MDGKTSETTSDFVSESVDRWLSAPEYDNLEDSIRDYDGYIGRKVLFTLICVLIAVITVGISLTVGDYGIGFIESYQTIWNHLIGNIVDEVKDGVVMNLRLPRILAGLIAGAALAVCGAAMQGSMLNPLADPYTTGVSAGAGFGATLSIALGFDVIAGQYGLVLNAFIFAVVPTIAIIMIGSVRRSSAMTIIMSGIAIMYIFNAMSTVIQLRADPNALSAIYRWMVGTLSNVGWEDIPLMFAVTLLGSLALQLLSGRVNILAMGDDAAKTMGVDAEKLRITVLIIIAFMTATIVSFTGLIGFVGLVAPHIVKIFLGSDNRYLFPASIFFGAALLVVADLIGRTVIAPAVLQVGVITAFLGGPLLLWLIIRKNHGVLG